MVTIAVAADVLLLAVAVIRLVRGELEPSLGLWLPPLAAWHALAAVAMTNTLIRSTGTTRVTTLGRTVRVIRDDDVVSLRMRGRRFEVYAGGREVCSVLTGHGVALRDVLDAYRDLAVSDPRLVADDQLLRRWAWQQGQA